MRRDPELVEKEEEAIIKPHCIINGCEHELEAVLESEDPLVRNGYKLTRCCDNGVDFKHVKTASGKHYGIYYVKDQTQTFETVKL